MSNQAMRPGPTSAGGVLEVAAWSSPVTRVDRIIAKIAFRIRCSPDSGRAVGDMLLRSGPMNAAATVLDFMNRVNQHDADKLAELMTEDHVFIDSLGQT